jgi:protein-S-isoprenylcysteine O-methyltransferase Ste14
MIRRTLGGGLVVPLAFGALALASGIHSIGTIAHALAHPNARAWLEAAYACLRTGVSVAFAVFTIGRAAARTRARSPLAFASCAVAMLAVVVFQSPPADTPAALVIGGELVAVVACAWLMVSVTFLGRCFGVLPEARGLVTGGPYGVVRHPVYLGEIGACAGLAIASPTVGNAIALAALCVAQGVRMRLEEQALRAAFPEYEGYARRVPRLLPAPRRRVLPSPEPVG